MQILIELQQIEPRNRRGRDVGKSLCLEDTALGACRPRLEEFAQDPFCLSKDLELRVGVDVRARRGVGAADHHRRAVSVRRLDQMQRVTLLGQHPAREEQIGPVEIALVEALGVAVDELQRP